MDLFDLINDRRHLGYECLIWLWARCDDDNATFGDEGQSVTFTLSDSIVLEHTLAETELATLKGGCPSASIEAFTALGAGKHPAQLAIRITSGEREWTAKLDSNLESQSVGIPSVLCERGGEDEFYEKEYLYDEYERAINTMYRAFLVERLDPKTWASTSDILSRWAHLRGLAETMERAFERGLLDIIVDGTTFTLQQVQPSSQRVQLIITPPEAKT